MNIFIHFLINFLVVLPFLSFEQTLIVAFAGILIDLDHILYQVIVKKHKSIKQMWDWHKKENSVHRAHLYIFHTVEFVAVLILISQISFLVFLITLGFVLHILVDLLAHIIHGDNTWKKYISIYGSLRNWSII